MLKQKLIPKDLKVLISNFFSLSILQSLNLLLPLLTFPYLVRVLGVDNFGLVMFAQSFILYFLVFVDFGFNYSATREISIHRFNKEKISEIFSCVIQIKIVFVLISFLILTLTVNIFEKFNSDIELYYLTFLYVIGHSFIPTWNFQGIEEMKYITYINILAKGSFTILIFLFIKSSEDYLYVPLMNGLGYIASAIFSLILVFKKYDLVIKFYNARVLLRYIKESFDYFLSRISVSLFTSSNVFVLGIFTNNIIVGYFSIAEKIYNALRSLYGPVSRTLYPYISSKKNITLYKKIFYSITLFNFLIVGVFWFFAPDIINIISGEFIDLSISVFRILIVYSIFTVPCSLLGYSFLAALGHKNFANYSVLVASIFHIFGLILLGYFDSITVYNIVYLIGISESIVLMIRVYGVYKHNLWTKNIFSVSQH